MIGTEGAGFLILRGMGARMTVRSKDGVLAVMSTYTAVVERCPETGLYVGYVPGFPGAHTQGATLDELNANLREVIALILEDGAPAISGEFVGTQTVVVA